MTRPYLFRWFDSGQEALSPVRLDAEPVVGQCVWIAGTRYQIIAVSADEITIKKPAPGYREPKNAIGTLSIMDETQ